MSFELNPTPSGVDVVVRGAWSDGARDAITSGQADGLDLNYAKGYSENDLEFLRGLPIRRLQLLKRTCSDIEPVYSLGDTLELLRIQIDPSTSVELDRLPRLRLVSANWAQLRKTFAFASAVEELFVHSYDEDDLSPLVGSSRVQKIVMKEYPKLRSLDGVDEFPNLNSLSIFLARRLDDISALSKVRSSPMRTLELEACRRVTTFEPVAGLTSLEYLNMSENSEYPTAEPLASLQRLRELYLHSSTRIGDGNLAPIAGLPELRDLRMRSRKHYTPSVEYIKEMLLLRG